MAIIITNVSDELKRRGEHDYQLRINNRVLALFKHKREDGLAKCLRLAADALEKQEREDFINFLKLAGGDICE